MPTRRKSPEQWNQEDYLEWTLMMMADSQIDIALQAHTEIEEAAQSLNFGQTPDRRATERHLWVSVYAFLTSAGILADFLQVPEVDGVSVTISRRRRGFRLRAQLGVRPGDILLSKDIRNHFTHISERIERHMRRHPEGGYSDLNLALPGSYAVKSDGRTEFRPEENALRTFDTITMTLHFLGDSLDMRALQQELLRLKGRLNEYLPAKKRHARLHRRLQQREREARETIEGPTVTNFPDQSIDVE